MRAARRIASSIPTSAFAGFRFPPEVITLAVRWYLSFGLSYRDVEELMAERGITVDHVSGYRWVSVHSAADRGSTTLPACPRRPVVCR
jgi:transposase-like protein